MLLLFDFVGILNLGAALRMLLRGEPENAGISACVAILFFRYTVMSEEWDVRG